MSTSPSAIPKVRTYAADLNSVRAAKPSQTIATKTVTAVTKSVNTNEKVIPPFHTFSKPKTTEIEKIPTPIKPENSPSPSLSETQKNITAFSTLKESGAVKENLPAVIITDTKHKRFKLSEAIVTSVQDWWQQKRQTAKQKKIPKYTVPVAERRKGVIQKATTKTGRTSTADHNAVLSRIKATKQIPHTTSNVPNESPKITTVEIPMWDTETSKDTNTTNAHIQNQRLVKKKTFISPIAIPAPSPTLPGGSTWETDIQAKVNTLAEPTATTPSPIIVTGKEFSKIKQNRAKAAILDSETLGGEAVIGTITPIIPPTIPKPVSEPAPVFATQQEIIRPVTPTPPLPPVRSLIPPVPEMEPLKPYTRPKILPIVPTTPTPTPTISVAGAAVLPNINSVDVPATTADQTVRTERRFAPPREPQKNRLQLLAQTNLMVVTVAIVIIVLIGSGLGIQVYRSTPTATTDVTVAVPSTTFSDTSTITETTVVTTTIDLRNRITQTTSEADSLVEIPFTNVNGNPLTAKEFLTLFDATVPFDFVASVNDIRFGNYRGAPWILLRISDKNTALGGMLAWETSMGRNLAPIFGSAETISYPRFTDSIINGIDVRLMKNENNVEEIVYGFVGYDGLLITSNTTAFLNLAQKIY